ncbi:albusnodin family lasso peptide [Streptomyces niveus]
MNDPATDINTSATEEELPIELGDIVVLTEGQGKGGSEDKRRAYNC